MVADFKINSIIPTIAVLLIVALGLTSLTGCTGIMSTTQNIKEPTVNISDNKAVHKQAVMKAVELNADTKILLKALGYDNNFGVYEIPLTGDNLKFIELYMVRYEKGKEMRETFKTRSSLAEVKSKSCKVILSNRPSDAEEEWTASIVEGENITSSKFKIQLNKDMATARHKASSDKEIPVNKPIQLMIVAQGQNSVSLTDSPDAKDIISTNNELTYIMYVRLSDKE